MALLTPLNLGFFSCMLFIFIVMLFFMHLNMRRNYRRFMKGLGNADVESLMQRYVEELMLLRIHLETKTEPRITGIERKLPTALRNVGMVSYNAFESMGNLMSFSIAMLDDLKNGFVISGIYGRDSSYVYAKDIRMGIPGKELSKEEREAIRIALESSRL